MSMIKEYYTIVTSNRRITVPPEFKVGEPVKVTVERIVEEKSQKMITKRV